jgi:glycosyltransferase involved in cell wall biosynthesis
MAPQVSVVISTYNRPERLTRLLDGLAHQKLDREQFEVIVVDDGSGPAVGSVLEAERARDRLTLRTLRHEASRGPATGRNQGWQTASSPLIAFTDDDCVPSPTWLAAGLAASESAPGAFIQGRTEPDPAELSPCLLLSRTVTVNRLGPQFETCNMFYPRELLAELGGFDERWRRPAGEDTDLAWRSVDRGAAAVYAPDALVHHAVERLGPIGTLRDGGRWGVCARLFGLHPQLRRTMLHHRLFWNVWHYLLLRSVVALLLAPPWLRHLVLARHLRALSQRARRAGAGSWGAAYLLLYDTIETASMVRGAVRYRTPVL